MSADFIWKKVWKISLVALCFFVTGVSFVYAYVLTGVEKVYLSDNFYFLVSKTVNVEVGAFESLQNGGAGYILEENGREYAVLSVYFTEEKALQVQNGLAEETLLLRKKTNDLYLKTRSDKALANTFKNAFSCLKSCMEILSEEIVRLDNGATQESSKRILRILQKQYDYLEYEYKKSFPDFAKLCERAEKALGKIVAGTVYVKDLRYLLCELCVSYNGLADTFEL